MSFRHVKLGILPLSAQSTCLFTCMDAYTTHETRKLELIFPIPVVVRSNICIIVHIFNAEELAPLLSQISSMERRPTKTGSGGECRT